MEAAVGVEPTSIRFANGTLDRSGIRPHPRAHSNRRSEGRCVRAFLGPATSATGTPRRTALGTEVEGVWDLYRGTFEHQSEDLEESDVERRITLNVRQRMVIVAEAFPPEMEQTLRYIRSKHGVDINAVRFGLHRAGDEILLETAVVVGRESVASITVKTERLSARSQGPQGLSARRQGSQGTDPTVQAKVTALLKEGKRNKEIAEALEMHPFQVGLARALTGQMKPGTMMDYLKNWAKKHT